MLNLRVAIHLQRVEIFVIRTVHPFMTEQHLGVRLDFEATQLLTQPLYGGFHFLQASGEIRNALLNART